MLSTCFGASSMYKIYLKKNTKISIFDSISKFIKLIVFGQILAILGRFSCHGSGWQHAFIWKEKKNVITFEEIVGILCVMAY
jgi:hypothetical protein